MKFPGVIRAKADLSARMHLYRLNNELIGVDGARAVRLPGLTMDDVFMAEDPRALVQSAMDKGPSADDPAGAARLQPPVQSQEIWAAGVTYFRSRVARMDESKEAGASLFYDMVYDADRPELFFKATAPRARGHGDGLRIRSDSAWNVPEPELTLAINAAGRVFGFTIGNDMSSRDIEGENPLYLPQAKVYRGSCAVGPCLLLADTLPPDTGIHLTITRQGDTAFEGSTSISQLKRGFDELAGWLFRENEFPCGCLLLTGTGLVPPGKWTLEAGDRMRIRIEGIGTLENEVEKE
ncbi:MAG TPA: fumarylacetoacetate hydrolase family protein [Verrucomicrobiales bacterium]|nr:fumarylacetoacetate hydrolase family protein [Verrucomicrobiales bacterium]